MKMESLTMFIPAPMRKRVVVLSNIVILVFSSLCVVNMASAQTSMIVVDDFNDGILDSAIWEVCSSDSSRYVIEKNGRLEIHSEGVEMSDGQVDQHSVANTRILLPVNKDFHVKVSFNAAGCDENSGLALVVRNAHTDSKCLIDEGLCIANGNQDPEPSGVREWIGGKTIGFDYVGPLFTERTSVSSGTFYITNKGGTFHLSYNGFGQENAFATFAIEDWTNCTEVFISLLGWDSGWQILSGSGSYFDDFSLTVSGAICTQRPAMDFNDDCKVDFTDLAIFMESWLECNLDPPEACWQ